MAAPSRRDPTLSASDSSDSDSDTDGIEQKKLREAAIDASNIILPGKSLCGKTLARGKSGTASAKPSLRPSEKSHDDENELNTTPEFRAHVAKKLSGLIDSKLDVRDLRKQNTNKKQTDDKEEEEEDDFHLFSTSRFCLNEQMSENSTQRVARKRYVSSSSDSEAEEERLASVAVDGSFILAHSAIPALSESQEGKSGELSGKSGSKTSDMTKTDKHLTEHFGKDSSKEDHNSTLTNSSKKKKKKKKQKVSDGDEPCNSASVTSETVEHSTKVNDLTEGKKHKKSKKKKRDHKDNDICKNTSKEINS